MPAPWWAPQAIDFGTKLLGGAIGGESEQDKLARRRQDFEEREAGYDRYTDLRDRNQRLGGEAYKNPMKVALLQKMAGRTGIDTSGMNLPNLGRYSKPAPVDPMRDALMRKFAPESVIQRVEQAKRAGGTEFVRFMESHPDTMRAYADLMKSRGGR